MSDPSALRLAFGRAVRLRLGREFLRLRREGRRRVAGCLIANWQARPDGARVRLGVVVGRKVGGAVRRSRARRLLREAFRLHQRELVEPVDLVLVARPAIAGKSLREVEADLLSTLRQVGLLKRAVGVPRTVESADS